MTRLLWLLAPMLMLGAACGGAPVVQQSPAPDESPRSNEPARPDAVPLVSGPVSADGLQIIFGTPDVGVGEHRIGFVLTSQTGLVRWPAATVASLYFDGEDQPGEPKQTALAVFRPWPYNTRGMYTTRLNFDKPGRWGINVSVSDTSGRSRRAELRFEVPEVTEAPAVGVRAARSRNKTVEDVADVADLTTGSLYDPDLYQTTIEQSVQSGLPTLVVMASPAFCTNAVCGPQVEVLQQLKESYRGQANFIHVDFYDNPQEIQGDLSKAVLSPTVVEWNLPSTEWSFVIDRAGAVYARFESFATYQELEEALKEVL